MRKAYLLVYADSLGSREAVKKCVDQISEVITWRYDMPNCFYLISNNEANDISLSIKKYFGNKGRFLVAEVTGNKQGWLPAKTWHLLNNKQHKKD